VPMCAARSARPTQRIHAASEAVETHIKVGALVLQQWLNAMHLSLSLTCATQCILCQLAVACSEWCWLQDSACEHHSTYVAGAVLVRWAQWPVWQQRKALSHALARRASLRHSLGKWKMSSTHHQDVILAFQVCESVCACLCLCVRLSVIVPVAV